MRERVRQRERAESKRHRGGKAGEARAGGVGESCGLAGRGDDPQGAISGVTINSVCVLIRL